MWVPLSNPFDNPQGHTLYVCALAEDVSTQLGRAATKRLMTQPLKRRGHAGV